MALHLLGTQPISRAKKGNKNPLFAICNLVMIYMLCGAATCLGSSSQSDLDSLPPLRIIVTTAGNNTVYSYSEESFQDEIKRNLHIFKPIEITQEQKSDPIVQRQVDISIGEQQYHFKVQNQIPVVRFNFDRNRRALTPQGLGSMVSDTVKNITYPSYKGTPLTELWGLWRDQIERNMDSKYLFQQESAKQLIIEIEIDEDGFVHDIKELGGTLKSYSSSCIATIFDIAAREWTPAQINGKKIRTRSIVILGGQSPIQ